MHLKDLPLLTHHDSVFETVETFRPYIEPYNLHLKHDLGIN